MAMGAFDSTLFWFEAVRQGNTADARNLIEILKKIETPTVRGIMKVNPIDHTTHNYPYAGRISEASVKAIVEGRPITDVFKELGMFPYGTYPYGPIAPLAQWQDGGRLVNLYPPEVAERTNPGEGYVSPRELRERAKK